MENNNILICNISNRQMEKRKKKKYKLKLIYFYIFRGILQPWYKVIFVYTLV